MGPRELCPFLDGILGTHGEIASRTYGSQIRELRGPAFTLWNIMTDVKIERGHCILAPGH